MHKLNNDRKFIVSTVCRLLRQKPSSQRNFMLNRNIRWYTEFTLEGKKAHGSFTMCLKYFKWTEEAAKIADKINSKKILRREYNKYLIHEHILPLKVVIEELYDLKFITKRKVIKILDQTEMIMVTKEEDKKLTDTGFQESGTREERLAILSPLDKRYINNTID